MSWINDAVVETKGQRVEKVKKVNKEKALAAQLEAIRKAEEDDLKTKYGIGTALGQSDKKALKDRIKALQVDIENPPSDLTYEPGVV